MPVEQVPIMKGDKVGIETDYRDALPVNMYGVKREILRSPGYMIEYPGLTAFGTGTGIDRGANYNERFGEQYRVSGQKLISVSSSGVVTELGTIPGTKQVAMPYSFNTQCVIADGKMFLYDPVDGFREVTDPDLLDPFDGTWINGYYLMVDGESVFHTNIADESVIDSDAYSTAAFMPDKVLGIDKTQDNKGVLFGRYSIEYLADIESTGFAFTRIEQRTQKIGIVATHAKCESSGKFYITGGRKNESVAVHIVGLGDSQKVSTREIDKIISAYTEPELADMRMECRTENDIVFILVHLPNETLCFNESIAATFGKEVAWTVLTSGTDAENYRAINGVFDARNTEWIYGDKVTSQLGKLDNSVATHYGSIAEWYLNTPILKLETFSIDKIELETIPGHTATDDATAALSITYDGLTYGSEWFELYGLPLDYGKRFEINRLGYVREWIGFRLRGATRSRMVFSGLKVTYA